MQTALASFFESDNPMEQEVVAERSDVDSEGEPEGARPFTVADEPQTKSSRSAAAR